MISRLRVPGCRPADGAKLAAVTAAVADRISCDKRQAVVSRSRLVMSSSGHLAAPRDAANFRAMGAAIAAHLKEFGYGG